MSRAVTLVGNDGKPVGNVLLPSDAPSEPGVLLYYSRAFTAGSIAFGEGTPGAYETYVECNFLTLPRGFVSDPDKAPTNPT